MMKPLLTVAVAVGLATTSAHANLISNPGFEDFASPAGGNDANLQSAGAMLLSNPITVEASDTNFQNIVERWGRGANGNWTVNPGGTENGSWAVATRKANLRWFQVLPQGAISAGQDLYLDWQYFVDTSIEQTATNTVVVFGVNEAGDGEAATTIGTNGSLGGESHNHALLGASTVSVSAGDSVWHDAPQTLIEVNDDWDYVGIYFYRAAGVTNVTSQRMDNFSLTPVPEPASLALLGMGGALMLLRRRSGK